MLPPKLMTFLRFIDLVRNYYGLNKILEVKILNRKALIMKQQKVPWFRKHEFRIRNLGYTLFTQLRQLLKRTRCLSWMIVALDKQVDLKTTMEFTFAEWFSNCVYKTNGDQLLKDFIKFLEVSIKTTEIGIPKFLNF